MNKLPNSLQNNNEQVIFFQGWSFSEFFIHPLVNKFSQGKQLKIICSTATNDQQAYQQVEPLLELIKKQQHTLLIGYSFGFLNMMFLVDLIAKLQLINKVSIIGLAISPLAINEKYGISPKLAKLTLELWQPGEQLTENRTKFFYNCFSPIELAQLRSEALFSLCRLRSNDYSLSNLLTKYLEQDSQLQRETLSFYINSIKWQQFFDDYLFILQQVSFFSGSEDSIFKINKLNRLAKDFSLSLQKIEGGHFTLLE